MPTVISSSISGMIFTFIFATQNGILNGILMAMGLDAPIQWLTSPDYVMSAVTVLAVWGGFGNYMLYFITGMNVISEDVYEAAKIDGANGVQTFFKITLPMLTPSTFFVFMMLTINSFKSFDLIYALTMGGPGTSTTLLANYIYNQTFVYWDYGKSAAASIILFIIVLGVTIVQFRGEKKFTDYL